MPDNNPPAYMSGDGGIAAHSINGNVLITNQYGQTPTKPPVLNLLPLMFDRDAQEGQVAGHLDKCFQQGHQIIPVVLAGVRAESPGHFVERYANFTLREAVQWHNKSVGYESVMHPPLEWPDKAASLDLRIQRLSEKLLRNIREISLDDKPDQKGQPKYRFETKGKHQIIYYFLTTEQASKVESELINRWIDFWLSVLLDTPKATVTIIFCLHSERYWLPFRREWSSHCAKGLRNVCKDKPSVLLLSSLAAPSKDRDTYNWALKHCQRAWKIANLEHDTPFPLDTAILHKGAVNAFGWFRRKRPLLDLMPELSKAVEEAHKT